MVSNSNHDLETVKINTFDRTGEVVQNTHFQYNCLKKLYLFVKKETVVIKGMTVFT